MAFSFSVQDEGGGNEVDFNDYDLVVEDYELPFDSEPDTHTVNIPGMVGGYTYINVAKPANLVLQVNVTGTDHADFLSNIDAIITALDPLTAREIYVDGIGKYWIGKRISGINTALFGVGCTAASFAITFICDDPTPYDAAGGT